MKISVVQVSFVDGFDVGALVGRRFEQEDQEGSGFVWKGEVKGVYKAASKGQPYLLVDYGSGDTVLMAKEVVEEVARGLFRV